VPLACDCWSIGLAGRTWGPRGYTPTRALGPGRASKAHDEQGHAAGGHRLNRFSVAT
jgi:hypothetical protein